MRPALFLTIFPLSAMATLNGRCSGSEASASQKANGICIRTSTCRSNGGIYTSGACPNDPDDVKCCTIGPGQPSVNPCGGVSICTWTSNGCSGNFISGQCPGGDNFKCCRF